MDSSDLFTPRRCSEEFPLIPPRAIVLSFDHLSRRCLGCYGHEWIETPNLDRLAGRAVVFDQHFAADECAPLKCGDSSPLWLILSQAGVETKQVRSVCVESRRIGLTMSKVPQLARKWYDDNQRRFEEKWGWVPPVTEPDLNDDPDRSG